MAHITIHTGSPRSAPKNFPAHAVPEFLEFPGGERHVRLGAPVLDFIAGHQQVADWTIQANLFSAANVMDLLLVEDALCRVLPPSARLHLLMPYVPYARQDRVAVPGEALSLKVFCGLINSLNFASVEIWDPHSDVTPALLDRVRIKPTGELMRQAFTAENSNQLLTTCTFVAPDVGARKRVAALAKEFGVAAIYADKVRDPLTGALSGAQVIGAIPDTPLLVVDDICDGGGTFTSLAQVLQTKTNQPLYLYVTHGLFTKGQEHLKQYFAHIFYANTKV